MFVIRAAFWLTAVSLLLPPLSAQSSETAEGAHRFLTELVQVCGPQEVCVSSAPLVDRLSAKMRQAIIRARAEIQAQKLAAH
jgi:hypothetical protein